MNIDVTKLAAPIAFKTGDGNSIANLDGERFFAHKTFSEKNIFRWMRLSSTRAANNQVRTAFLRSLGEAFGLEGATVGNDGKTRFTKEFMDRLEEIFGADFKRGDFGIDKDGVVASGKPLTERRITAIVTRALVVGKTPFDVDAYRAKVGEMLKMGVDAKLEGKAMLNLRAQVSRMNKALDFLADGGVDAFIEENPYYVEEDEASQGRGYYVLRNADEDGEWPYRLITENGRVPLKAKIPLGEAIFAKYSGEHGGVLLHLDNLKVSTKNRSTETDEYVDFRTAVMAYVHDSVKAYVKMSVDMFYDTVGTDACEKLAEDVFNCTACIEGQTMELIQFQAEHALAKGEEADGAEAVNLAVADHDQKTDLLECLAREAQAVENANKGSGKELGWDDYRPVFVKNLVGLVRPVQIEANGPVETREVTEADVDALRDRLNAVLCFEG